MKNDIRSINQMFLCSCLGLTVVPGTAFSAAESLDEIIVTAQKREQNIQDVPIFISMVSAETLDLATITSFNELSKMVPGITIDGPTDGLGGTITMRGIGTTRFVEGIAPSIGAFIDGIPQSRLDMLFTNFVDIDRIEILKGPQATLFGKEVAAGAIALYTKKPHTDAVEGNLGVNIGNFDFQEYQGTINLPLGDNNAVRFSGYSTQEEGEIKNIVTDERGELETWGGRLRLLSKITDDVETILTLARHEAKARNMVREKVDYGVRTLAVAAADNVTLLERDVFDRKTEAAGGDGRSTTNTLTSLDISWDINDAWSFNSLTGYQEFDRDNDEGDFPGEVNNTTSGLFNMFAYLGYTDDKTTTQEFRFTYEGGSLSTVIGAFYEHFEKWSRTDILTRITPTFSVPLVAYGDRDSEDLAVFVHNIYKFNSQWDLTAGLRYAETDADDRVDNLNGAGAFGSGVVIPPPSQKDNWSSVSGTLKLSYHMNENIHIYGGYDRGFKPGGHNNYSSTLPKYDEEVADNFEVGIKGTSLDRRLRWSTSLFYTEYTDFQVNSPSEFGGSSFFQNAASVEIPGIEAEVTWLVSDNFTLDGQIAYVKSEFGDFEHAECTDLQKTTTPGCTQDLTGEEVSGNSPLTWNLNANYKSVLENTNLHWYFYAGLVYRDSTNGLTTLDERADIDDYTLVNASLGLSSADGSWDLALWGKNLSDEDYISAYEIARDGNFGLNADLGDSRTYGIKLKYNF